MRRELRRISKDTDDKGWLMGMGLRRQAASGGVETCLLLPLALCPQVGRVLRGPVPAPGLMK